jgi:hypothetical protein
MPDLRPVLFVVGLLICAIGVAMVVPATMNWLAGTPPPEPFSIAAALSLGLGGCSCWRTAAPPSVSRCARPTS